MSHREVEHDLSPEGHCDLDGKEAGAARGRRTVGPNTTRASCSLVREGRALGSWGLEPPVSAEGGPAEERAHTGEPDRGTVPRAGGLRLCRWLCDMCEGLLSRRCNQRALPSTLTVRHRRVCSGALGSAALPGRLHAGVLSTTGGPAVFVQGRDPSRAFRPPPAVSARGLVDAPVLNCPAGGVSTTLVPGRFRQRDFLINGDIFTPWMKNWSHIFQTKLETEARRPSLGCHDLFPLVFVQE